MIPNKTLWKLNIKLLVWVEEFPKFGELEFYQSIKNLCSYHYLLQMFSNEDISSAMNEVFSYLKLSSYCGFRNEKIDAKIEEVDRQIEKLQVKIDELEHADKFYLDKEDLCNPINEKQFQRMVKSCGPKKGHINRVMRCRRYPKRNIPQKNYALLEVPDDDQFLFCEDCNIEYLGFCPLHGPLLVVQDKTVKDGEPHRARNSLPDGLIIMKSSIPGAGEGVFSTASISKDIRFGPYEGEVIKDPSVAHESGYMINQI